MSSVSEHPEYRFFEADRLIGEGRVVEAAEILHALVADHPTFGRAYNHLGYIYETRFRDHARAEAYYREGLSLNPDYPAVYLNFAILLSSQQRWDELADLLERALQCPGINAPKVLHEKGMMLEARGNYALAMAAYLDALRMSFAEQDIVLFQRSITRLEGKLQFFNARPENVTLPDTEAN